MECKHRIAKGSTVVIATTKPDVRGDVERVVEMTCRKCGATFRRSEWFLSGSPFVL